MQRYQNLSDLGGREVINLADGARLGFVQDAELDLAEGRIRALVMPGRPRWLGLFGRTPDVYIPWEAIRRVGEDIIFISLERRRMPALEKTVFREEKIEEE